MPPLARDLVETTAWEPFRDEAERREEVDGEETGGEKDVELVRRLVSDADQVVVLMFGPVTVGYPKDDDAHRPRKSAIKKSMSTGINQRKEGGLRRPRLDRTYLRTGPTKFLGSSNKRRSISAASSSRVSRNLSTLARVPMTD